MESLRGFIEFLASYPTWAKLLALSGLIITIGTLVLADRNKDAPDAASAGDVVLRIASVTLFPHDPDAEIQVLAHVNDTRFQYPSLAGVSWLKVGPAMSSQRFTLPKAPRYEIRFEMNVKTSGGALRQLVSQEQVIVATPPHKGDYNLHMKQGATRAASVEATVHFALERAG